MLTACSSVRRRRRARHRQRLQGSSSTIRGWDVLDRHDRRCTPASCAGTSTRTPRTRAGADEVLGAGIARDLAPGVPAAHGRDEGRRGRPAALRPVLSSGRRGTPTAAARAASRTPSPTRRRLSTRSRVVRAAARARRARRDRCVPAPATACRSSLATSAATPSRPAARSWSPRAPGARRHLLQRPQPLTMVDALVREGYDVWVEDWRVVDRLPAAALHPRRGGGVRPPRGGARDPRADRCGAPSRRSCTARDRRASRCPRSPASSTMSAPSSPTPSPCTRSSRSARGRSSRS